MTAENETVAEETLLQRIKESFPELEELLERVGRRGANRFYKFYSGSFKTYDLQTETREIVEALRAVMPERRMDGQFLAIMERGTGRVFQPEHNERWIEEAGPVVEAFLHAEMMLRQMVECGRNIGSLPVRSICPGWQLMCCLYGVP
ncbi:MAG: hypothetical protein KF712_13380 [Akkermansiaceae bacterium]|nr:hypothetical protein [Akkermansiaceae bacterium]